MTAPRDPAQTTVYADNARRGAGRRRCEAGWAQAFARLVERDYAFLPLGYAPPGWLFRGIDRGLAALLAGEPLALNTGEHALAALEREAGVLFVSQDVSDALSVTRLWAAPPDAAILAIPAAAFAAAQADGRAAVLGFADPGVVFRYPAFAAPLAASAVSHVFVAAQGAAAQLFSGAPGGPQVVAVPAAGDGREPFATALEAALAEHGIDAAGPQAAARWPRLAVPA
ncbi:MAG: hypothetical protein H6977_19375 [Gammaproteobacteria bacterium]|nr:hypothetical protein [Gammaproteobacteria bacterium]